MNYSTPYKLLDWIPVEDISTSSSLFQNNKLLSLVFNNNSFLSRYTLSFFPGKPLREWTFPEAVRSGHMYLVKILYPAFKESGKFLRHRDILKAIDNHAKTSDIETKNRYFNVIKFVIENCTISKNGFYRTRCRYSDYSLDILNLLSKDKRHHCLWDVKLIFSTLLNFEKFDAVKLLLKNGVCVHDDEILFTVYEKADIETVKQLFLSGIKPEQHVSENGKKIAESYENILFCTEEVISDDSVDGVEINKSTLLCFYKVRGEIRRDVWHYTSSRSKK